MDDLSTGFLETETGILEIKASKTAITSVRFTEVAGTDVHNQLTKMACLQLREYIDGKRSKFDLPLHTSGTPFQKKIWEIVSFIPFGSTATYARIASIMGDTGASQAVGNANAANPLLILIPCHRVVGSNNKLTGYAGGRERKAWLLRHEGVLLL